ncbi:MAG: ribosomal protein methylthiotransferase [Chloroflexia bacterium]|jgi:ribosomal protein S12 methylthiotransferase|nr:ribosomal protein methylthiotransferase [Chloroflexia bacterium]
MPKFNIVTLGCEKNNVDSEGMGSLLVEAGYEQSTSAEDSDLLIVNTCAFLQAAVDESVGELKALAENKREGQVLISAGCMSERYAADVPTWVPGVDGTISTRAWPEIVPFVEKLRGQGSQTLEASRSAGASLLTEIAPASIAWAPIAPVQMTSQLKRFRRKAKGPSAYVKISEGCDHKCAFCIIPAIRGKHISRPVEEIAGEVAELAEQGVKEVVLIAQDSTYYGIDLGYKDGLARLFGAITEQAPGIMWVRLMYAYPTQVSPSTIEAMSRYPQVAKYIDMPLQHAHPDMLKRMKRPNDVERTRRLIGSLREAMPGIALRTTFIVGFPGETDEEFRTLLDFLDEMKFDNVGMFTYSPEKGTPAAEMPDQVPEKLKMKRYREAMLRQQKISAQKNRRLVGQTMDVLLDGAGTVEDGKGRVLPIYAGRTYRQAPEVDGMVFVKPPKSGTLEQGAVVRVKITESTEYDLWGKTV